MSKKKQEEKEVKIIYCGLDTHKDTISACCYDSVTTEFFYETKMSTDLIEVLHYLEIVKEDLESDDESHTIQFVIGYESGCLGFSLAKSLIAAGYDCKVMATTTIVKTFKNNILKTDKLDAQMLAWNLSIGRCSYVHIPDDEDLQTRDYIRMVSSHKDERKRIQQRINAFVLSRGFHYNEKKDCTENDKKKKTKKKYWTIAHIKWLESITLDSLDREILNEYLDTYRYLNDKIERLEDKIHEFAQKDRYKDNVDILVCFKGIKETGAMTILTEVGDFNRFNSAQQVSAYYGLTPGQQSSGNKIKMMPTTKDGNPFVRKQVVETAHALGNGRVGFTSKDLKRRQRGKDVKLISYCNNASNRLIRKYNKLIAEGKHPNVAATAIAREFLCYVWGALTNHIEERL